MLLGDEEEAQPIFYQQLFGGGLSASRNRLPGSNAGALRSNILEKYIRMSENYYYLFRNNMEELENAKGEMAVEKKWSRFEPSIRFF